MAKNIWNSFCHLVLATELSANVEIVVADNGSTDDSLNFLQKKLSFNYIAEQLNK
jgi:glycosyltransferase involved in cell wall biosynthesis